MLKAISLLYLYLSIVYCIECTYTYGGQNYDLSPLTLNNENYEAPDGMGGIIALNICGYSSAGCSGANQAAVCQILDDSKYNCGLLNQMTLGPNLQATSESKGALLTYSGGTFCGEGTRSTNVVLSCKENEPLAVIETVSISPDGCTFTVQMNTKYVCPKDEELSGGSIFLIIVACGFVVYCGVGIVYKAVKLRAKGPDVIPNYDFWLALPVLIRDGAVFTVRTLTCRTNKQAYSNL